MNILDIFIPCLARHAAWLELDLNEGMEVRKKATVVALKKAAESLSSTQFISHLEGLMETSFEEKREVCASADFTYAMLLRLRAEPASCVHGVLLSLYKEIELVNMSSTLFTGVKPLVFSKYRTLCMGNIRAWEVHGAHLIPIHKKEMGEDWDDSYSSDYIHAAESYKEYCSWVFTERGSAAPGVEPFKRLLGTIAALPGAGIQEWRPRK